MNLLKILLLLVLLNCVVLFLSVDCAKLTNLQSEPAVDIKFANNTNSTIDSRSDVVKLNSTSLSVQSPRESSYSYVSYEVFEFKIYFSFQFSLWMKTGRISILFVLFSSMLVDGLGIFHFGLLYILHSMSLEML